MILRFICLAGVLMTSTFSSAADDVIRTPFGKTKEGEAVDIFTLQNSKGMKVRLITFGATIQSIEVPDNKGKMADVIVGFDTLEGFLTEHPYFGGTIGRVCNRIGNANSLSMAKTIPSLLTMAHTVFTVAKKVLIAKTGPLKVLLPPTTEAFASPAPALMAKKATQAMCALGLLLPSPMITPFASNTMPLPINLLPSI